jgi:hypothetical protein
MRNKTTRFLLAAALAILPVAVFAAAPPAKYPTKPATHTSNKATTADHATMGVVKSVNGTALTISRSGKDQGEMSFVLNPSTKRDGKIEVGAPVSVRYREDGASHVATAISTQHNSTAQQSSATHGKSQSTGKPQPSGTHR